MWYENLRAKIGGDFIGGHYFYDLIDNPVSSSYLGQFQFAFEPSTVNAGAFFDFMTESTYATNAQLPGINV